MNERDVRIVQALQQAGVTSTALPDAMRRALLDLAGDDHPTELTLQLLGERYKVEHVHYFPCATLSPEVPTLRSRRPEKMALNSRQLGEIPPQLSPSERLTKAREIEKKAKS